SAQSSQIVTPCSLRYLTLVSPARNQSSSWTIDLRCSFLVVVSGKPSARSKRIWWPNTDSVPVPVRSRFSAPSARIRSISSWYWRMCELRLCRHGAERRLKRAEVYRCSGHPENPISRCSTRLVNTSRHRINRLSVHRPGRLDDRRPARDLALDQTGQRLLAATGLVRQHAAELEQALARVLIVERLVERIGELVEHWLWRRLGGEQRVPRLRL